MATDPASHISQGFLRSVLESDGMYLSVAEPILQCVQIKPLGGGQGGMERYRVVFSDMLNFVQTMLATQANHVVYEGKLQVNSIVRLKQFNANVVKGKQILIILDLEVLEELGQPERLGKPIALEPKLDEVAKPTSMSTNGFYGTKEPKQESHSQGLPARTSRPMDASMAHVHPIESLSPYGNKWTIKARVTSKSDVKTWHNKNGEGKLFSVNLLDESGEIKATGFNDQCDMFFDTFQEGNVYYISSPCRVQLAKKQFSNLNNDYELTFENNTRVEKAESQSDVPQVRFNFTSIGNLQSIEKDAVIDTIGILREVGEVSEIIAKTTQKPYSKRELTLVDNTNFSVRLTIWGTAASSFETPLESVIAFKGVKVSDFGGRSLSLLSSGTINVNPDVNEAHVLKGWYDAQGRNDQFTTHAVAGTGMGDGTGRQDSTKTIQAVKDENLGMGETPEYFTVKATINYIRHDNPAYAACLSPDCNKKVIETEDGWRCEKCNKTHPKPEYRYMMSINVADHTGQVYLSCFDETGRIIMGMSADQLMELKDNGTDKEVYQDATGQTLNFRCRAKMDTYQDQPKVRYQVLNVSRLNYEVEAAKLINLIKLYD